jgi:hypothetical protein
MKFIISENKLEKLEKQIQIFIDYTLNTIREQSEEWGLGEMDELYEIDSIDKISINRITPHKKLIVYIDIYQNKERDDYDNTMAEIQYTLKDIFPNIVIHLNEIILNE